MAEQAIGSRSGAHAPARDGLYVGVAIVTALIIFAGFAPSYYLKGIINAPPPLTPLSMAHGVVFTAWVVLFLAQALFISSDQRRLHRQVGMAGAMLFGGMFALGVSTAITAGRLGHVPPASPEPLLFMALPLMGILGIAVVMTTGLVIRGRRDWHQRLMASAAIMMTQPAVGRFFIPSPLAPQATQGSFFVIEALLVAVILLDWRRERRVHPAWLFSLGVVAITNVGVLWAFTAPPAWVAFAEWATRS